MSKEAKKIEAPRFENYPDIVTVKQLKEMLGVGNNQALNLIHDNKIKHFRIGRIIKIPKSLFRIFTKEKKGSKIREKEKR